MSAAVERIRQRVAYGHETYCTEARARYNLKTCNCGWDEDKRALDKHDAEAQSTATLEARVVHLERALKTIATIEHCDECETFVRIAVAFTQDEILQHRLDHPVTHETTFFGLRRLLCTECAERVAQAHRKAESKGCGPQPEVSPRVERRAFTTLALDALKNQPTTPAQPTTAQAVALVHNISMTRVRVLWDKLAEELGIIRAAEEDPER